MKFLKELNKLGDLLAKSGLDQDDAKDLVVNAAKRAKVRKTSVIRALKSYASPGAKESSKSLHLHIVLKEIGDARLNSFEKLAAGPTVVV